MISYLFYPTMAKKARDATMVKKARGACQSVKQPNVVPLRPSSPSPTRTNKTSGASDADDSDSDNEEKEMDEEAKLGKSCSHSCILSF